MRFLRTSIALVIVSLAACTAYYNTFFNAKKYFDEANQTALGTNGKPTSQAIQKYNECIKRCGVVLSDYPKSKYNDDALFLLGKAFFYKQMNYYQAIEKFDDLKTFYPESEFIPEAEFYRADSYYLLNQKNEAYRILQDFMLKQGYSSYFSRSLYKLADFSLPFAFFPFVQF